MSEADTRNAAQAELFRTALLRHVEDISQRIERAERKERRVRDWSHRQSGGLRAELYEAHRLIDELNRRFPRTT